MFVKEHYKAVIWEDKLIYEECLEYVVEIPMIVAF